MREILTQEEVDALLEAYDKGEVKEAAGPDTPSFCTPFDFMSRKLIGGVQQTILEIIQDAFSKGAGGHLAGVLRREIRVTTASTYNETVTGFLSHFKGSVCIGLLSADAPGGRTFLAMSPFLAYALIDLMLGGDGNIEDPEEREFSAAEIRLVQTILSGLAKELTKAWSQVSPRRFVLEKVETRAKKISAGDGQDSLYVMNMRLEAEAGPAREFCVALPLSLIEPLKSREVRGPEADPKAEEFSARLKGMLETVPVEVSVLLGETQIPIREVLSLKPGDLIATERDAGSCVRVFVEGMSKLSGRAGISRGKRAVKITVN
jgi:flagellar motor switch protein FliM